METSQSLSIESFSYSWLVDLGDSFRASMDDYETAFIEMDPALPPSKRFFNVNPQDLNFNFPTSDSALTLVHADELISNGLLMPLFIKKPMKMESDYGVIESDSIANSPASSAAAQQQDESRCSSRVNRCVSLRRCRSLSRRILVKYFDFLRPFCQKIRRCSRIGRCRSSSGKEVMKKWDYCSAATSPRISVAYSVDNWRRSCDSESSIYEAVLHCKRNH
ncbi:probable membrane-associated kinase regulator 6 [Solanum pennellii]|uniref:Probable membrane-associated kinase regulator 6 n=1 Tax=Solanum pennellii TaxID=28526 RepID=A0ABM1GAD5_SOLPN|nr:probable membrane-associated kinase regulator 6 [Solanum pennellii]XP_015068185.1 probable membrane-associated kinase regulator 6 [Solanum pennellii]